MTIPKLWLYLASMKNLKFNLSNYPKLLVLSLTRPKKISKNIPLKATVREGIYFFLASALLGSLLSVALRSILTLNLSFLFLGISASVFSIPILLAGLLLFSLIVFFTGKLLGGKLRFREILLTVCFCSTPLLFIYLPLVFIAASVYLMVLLALSLNNYQGYGPFKATINVAVPYLLAILVMFMLGFLN